MKIRIFQNSLRGCALAWLVFASVLFGLLGSLAHADEVINSFSANIIVLENGSVDVTETISVRAEGRQIRRGIFRDIPTTLSNDDGSIIRSNLRVVSIQRDGVEEPWHTESIDNGLRIFIGDSDVYLATGNYEYTIRYTMTRMARRFENYDELYWNATGSFWTFPIKTAVAQVTLPEGARIAELQVYTGAFGGSGSKAVKQLQADNRALFRTIQPLNAREGMTVSVSFGKGALADLSGWDRLLSYLSDHRNDIFPSLAAFLISLYYYFAWSAVGRDPKKGTIIPLFYPPNGFSPALVHYIHNYGWRKSGWTAFSTVLISLAAKGLIEIDKTTGKFEFKHTDKELKDLDKKDLYGNDLPPGERLINRYLKGKGSLVVSKSNGPKLSSKKSEMIAAIVRENTEQYFKLNIGYIAFGVFLTAALLIGLVFLEALDPALMILAVGAGILTLVVGILFSQLWSINVTTQIFLVVWIGVVLFNLFGATLSFSLLTDINLGLLAAVSIVVVNVAFGFFMRAPTVTGRQIMDQIDGFKLYLETAEKDRLEFMAEPDFSIKRFEAILPYAVALGVERKWSDRLAGELSRKSLEQSRSGYHPHWYHGGNFSADSMSRDISGIASGVSSAMISAQPSKSSSSGGGGGGFSGGGGGGGGGGGW